MIDSKQFDTLIVDEAHMAMAKTWQKAFNYFDADLKLGLTATPWRGDGMPLGDLFDKIVYQYNIFRIPCKNCNGEGYITNN